MKSAFITGAATGIGEALVLRLQRDGWQVFAGYRNNPPDQTGWFGMTNVIAVPCDVTDPNQVHVAASTISGHTGGRLDLLINNAGYASREGVIEAANMAEYRRAFEVNFWGPVQVVQAMMPMLRQCKGRIINTTSASVYMTIPMASAYPAAKAALVVFTQHLRMELAPFGIGDRCSRIACSRLVRLCRDPDGDRRRVDDRLADQLHRGARDLRRVMARRRGEHRSCVGAERASHRHERDAPYR
jgi:NAD(P)-dependent dehydrogenase (short-subunit alcohol dehydrogenase family)